MSLSDDLAGLRAPTITCGTCRWLAEQTEADRAEFDACVKNCLEGSTSRSALHSVCRQHGLTVQISAFQSHINRCYSKGES